MILNHAPEHFGRTYRAGSGAENRPRAVDPEIDAPKRRRPEAGETPGLPARTPEVSLDESQMEGGADSLSN